MGRVWSSHPKGRPARSKTAFAIAPTRFGSWSGLLFAYLGPDPVPLLPRWDVLVREDGRRFGVIESVIGCNWLQAMENSVDPSHLYWLHGSLGSRNLPVGEERFAALGLQSEYEEENEFFEVPYGIMKRRTTPNPKAGAPPEMEQHPLVFPTYLRLVPSLSSLRALDAWQTLDEEERTLRYVHDMDFRTPIDDTHTMEYRLCFLPSKNGMSADEDPPFEVSPFKDPQGHFRLDFIPAQDALAWESQGALTDRTREHLGRADHGVIMLRKLVRDQIEVVQRGEDPIGVIRDPAKNVMIDLDVVHEPLGLYRATEPVVSASHDPLRHQSVRRMGRAREDPRRRGSGARPLQGPDRRLAALWARRARSRTSRGGGDFCSMFVLEMPARRLHASRSGISTRRSTSSWTAAAAPNSRARTASGAASSGAAAASSGFR